MDNNLSLVDVIKLNEQLEKDKILYKSHLHMFTKKDILKKSASIIMANESRELKLCDKRLFNFLLAHAYADVDKRINEKHTINVDDLLAYTGLSDIQSLDNSLHRLSTVNIEIKYLDAEQGEKLISVVTHYLGYKLVWKYNQKLDYAFNDVLLDFLYSPSVYGSLSLSMMQSFKTSYSARLYEIMALHANRRKPEWFVSLNDFRALFGLENVYPRLDNLRRRVIDPAIEEINNISPFLIDMEDVRKGKGAPITHLRFFIYPRSMETVQMLEKHGAVNKSRRGKRLKEEIDLFRNQWFDAQKTNILSNNAMDIAFKKVGSQEELDTYISVWKPFASVEMPIKVRDKEFLTWLDIELGRVRRRKADNADFTISDAMNLLTTGWDEE